MRAIVHINHAEHQRQHAGWMAAGMGARGVTVTFGAFDEPAAGDVAVVWGWRQGRVIEACRSAGRPILVMERGHLGDRMHWTSVGWGGLGRRATYGFRDDGGRRFQQNFAMEPIGAGIRHVLVCGQVEGDAALGDTSPQAWAQMVTDQLRRRGHSVVYRPHPLTKRHGDHWCPVGAAMSPDDDLLDSLVGARACVTFNSTAGVEAGLAGYPVVAMDEGSMAWPIASHSVRQAFRIPDAGERRSWASRLSWTQFTPEEIRSGFAWDVVLSAMPR